MSGVSHLSGRRGRGRGTTPVNRTQQLAVPGGRGVPTPTTRLPSTPTWVPDKDSKQRGESKEKKLPQYVIPDDFSSSEEEEEVGEEVLLKVLGRYDQDRESITSKLAELYRNSSLTCLVCISTVRHSEPVWSCPRCSDSFHLVCIQKWARDGIKPPSLLSTELFPLQDTPWFCPKCRQEFSKNQIPNRYYCFCKKKEDPKYEPWVAPHSCGEVCDKALTPKCGHSCLLLCHPGPCPPCPKQVHSSCYCGKKSSARRCGQARWSCGGKCGKFLQCGQHSCNHKCHEGDCPPCARESLQACRCGKEEQLRQCLHFDWQCGRVCGRKLPCGKHSCMETCHAGPCSPCPQSLRTTCPCGKTPLPAHYPCDKEVPTCEESCDKALPCGEHTCFKLCHVGPCDSCLQVRDKKCRCGRTHKEVRCSQELTCESKCNTMKECGRHSCRKKCCVGADCRRCDKRCDRTLPCRKHKCAADCHSGYCYPCSERVEVKCACGHKRVEVACGRERNTRPPRCNRACSKPTQCHHPTQEPHPCHYSDCPPCKQTCGITLAKCEHSCTAPCHDKVLELRSPGPGNHAVGKIECPPCSVLVQVQCRGEHEISTVKCSEAKSYSCLRACGRLLSCGNHTCERECHPSTEGCDTCEKMCTRVWACPHNCTRPCHPDPCPPCRQYIRLPCHCGILHLSVKCILFSEKKNLDSLLSCGSNCIKLLECGHPCRLSCHLGPCSKIKDCKRKVTLYCACRRVKKEMRCGEVYGQEEKWRPLCEDGCYEISGKPDQDSEVQEKVGNEGDTLQALPRRRRRNKLKTDELTSPSFYETHSSKLLAFFMLCVAVAGIYFCTLEP